MIKTDVDGMYTDGRGSVVNRDLSKYHAEVARRKQAMAQQDLRGQVDALRAEVAELRRVVQELMENNK